ncbi:MAG: hypothetical protein IIA17_07965 [candidate division Zixibacteria bacterium]|nr:hypothetical protein [candidate division Zixibacteria bacterium]
MSNKRVMVGSEGKPITTTTEEGVTSFYTVPGPTDTEIVHLDADVGATAGFMLIDLSDTTNWPHTNTGHINLLYVIVTTDPTSNFDGDIDIAVFSYNFTQGSSIFYYENQSDPTGFSATSITIQGEDNAQFELISPSNKVLNRVSSTIPTGSYYRRNINQNSILDDYASMSVTESGNYILSVKPEPTQPINTPFTVEFTVNGNLFRLAKDATMTETGYNFNVNFGNGSGYAPKSGSFIYINPPAFLWPNNSAVDFQLAADLDFASIVIDTTIATLLFQPAVALSILDTTTYYWRIRPTGETEFSAIYAFNLVPSSPGCGDIDGLAGPINILDLTYLVDFMFRGGSAPPDLNLADLTNDGNVNILDLTFMIDFIFRGGSPPPC